MPYARFQKAAVDAAGNVLTNVWCEVRREDVAGSPLEPLFADRMGDTPLSNPFMAADGVPVFHAAGGAFRIRYYKSGYDETYRYVGVGLGSENDLQGFVPMGAWDDETTYTIGDVVTHPDGGDLYLFASKVNDNLAQTPNAVGPADTAYWAYIGVAVQGPAGPSGVIGTWRGPWVTLTAYALHDAVQYAGSSYICISSHTAGTFATDLAASKWQVTTAKGDHGDVESIVEGTGIDVDASDPANPVVSLGSDVRLKFSITRSALQNEPPASNYATIDARNSRPVLDFDASTQETAIFSGVIPDGYDSSSGLTVDLHWAATSATSGTIGWDLAFEKSTGLDGDSDSFGTTKTAIAATVPAAAGERTKTSVVFAHAEIDGLVAGDEFRLRVRRDVASDSATGDAELSKVVVRQT